MKKLFNLSVYNFDWFNNDWQEVKEFCEINGLAGIELLSSGLENIDLDSIPQEIVKAMHLSYYLNWVSLEGNNKRQLEEKEVINTYRKELEMAAKLEVDYVVFHASSISMGEVFSDEFSHTNFDILSAVAQVINKVTKGLDIDFKLLFENLWWSGLTFLNKEEAMDFLDKLDYKNVGFLLDTGHLMNTNLELNSEKEGLDLFYGVHLHKSLSRSYRLENRERLYQEFVKKEGLEAKEQVAGQFIANSDQHLPFSEISPQRILDLIKPVYITHEFTATKKGEFIKYLQIQDQIL
ncbi:MULTISPECIES: sugar phosphate isomerase/epimerase family protein [unclassified Candidatus Frackibacter]|uniref:sugar phosphate isomerase/epimerase family protein n=1 Tax=unclassified Candidatus Frackibacter TaxID=2648818 RepID=UPI00088A578E|nr:MULTISPECIES: TIM barrel protein [unclassified Candidatus Frackibacter]SDC34701.1 Xylose isomerase-like TIM barrel [Candidatus Frackibacter sp. WG11]SEM56658.1 Xylose isomerase-like TIM barrel [Candidatus Frackibacter sp. WG12]SFL70637.1 Xylose isomerase-like TIM barrel [Candidatus Frackibacter sp. WG13]